MIDEITKQEFGELYKNVEFKFDYYYKFTFHYTGRLGGQKIIIDVGGDSSEIYKHTVYSDDKGYFEDLDPLSGRVVDIATNNTILNFFDY
jgi:hypothetical protein